jgi:sulfur carrier protein
LAPPCRTHGGAKGLACRYNVRMHITLNGRPHDCGDNLTVIQLLHEAGYAGRRVAVEVNQEIVPRSQHESYALREGDKVEIVHAIGGG